MDYERKFIADIKSQLQDSRGFIQVIAGPMKVVKPRWFNNLTSRLISPESIMS